VNDCTIRLRLDEAYAPKIRPMAAEVAFVGSRELTRDMREFQFRGRPAEFLSGQYALLSLPGVAGARAYSMSNIANAEGEWHFQVKKVASGAASTFLFELLRLSHRISIDAPYSIAYLRPEIPRDIICIAGGSGLAPMVSIARGTAASEERSGRKLHFFYGVGGLPISVARWSTNYQALPSAFSTTRSYQCRSWTRAVCGMGRVGFVHELVGTTLRPAFSSYEYYLAGPPPIVETCVKLVALQEKVPFSQIHYDRFF
jgi:toluene monooxygenase electron transfer component